MKRQQERKKSSGSPAADGFAEKEVLSPFLLAFGVAYAVSIVLEFQTSSR